MPGVDELPAQAEDIAGVQEMRNLMGALRAAFTQNPGLKARVDGLAASSGLDDEGQRMIRALAALYAGPDQRYLNFYGPPGTVLTFRPMDEHPNAMRGNDLNTTLFPDVTMSSMMSIVP